MRKAQIQINIRSCPLLLASEHAMANAGQHPKPYNDTVKGNPESKHSDAVRQMLYGNTQIHKLKSAPVTASIKKISFLSDILSHFTPKQYKKQEGIYQH